jgi:hypothetical protein
MSASTAMYKRNQEKIRFQYPINTFMKLSDFIPAGSDGSTVTKVPGTPPPQQPSKTAKRKAAAALKASTTAAAATKKTTAANTAANAAAPASNTRNFASKTVSFAPPPGKTTYNSTYCINDFAGKTIPAMPFRAEGYACKPKAGKVCTRTHYNLAPGLRLPRGIADDLISGLATFNDTFFVTNFRDLVNGMV